jgi:glucosamine-6-phosphate deaminase
LRPEATKPNIEVLPDGGWGAAVGARLAERVAAQPGIRLCLPTGNTPVPAYRAFAESGGRLDQTELFLLDEFGLPGGHPARCDEMLQRSLLELVATPPAALHSIDVAADDVAAACARHADVVADGGLDLTLLGLGANGHLGLNEPGSEPHSPTRIVELHEATVRNAAVYGEGAAPQWGVTLGLGSLLASREIWLLVTGAAKAEILYDALTGSIGPAVPASYLQNHPNAIVLADQAAAARFG